MCVLGCTLIELDSSNVLHEMCVDARVNLETTRHSCNGEDSG